MVEKSFLNAEESQIQRLENLHEMVAAFENAASDQTMSEVKVVVIYKAQIERVEHYSRDSEHVFRFTDEKRDAPTSHFSVELTRNADGIRDEFLKINAWHGAFDFLSNSGLFSPIGREVTWSTFKRWQEFALLGQEHTRLKDATNLAELSGECAEALKALTGDSSFASNFFNDCEIPQPSEADEWATQYSRDHPESIPLINQGMRLRESAHRDLCSWFRRPPVSLELIPRSKEAEQKVELHYQENGFGPWMIEFILPLKELRPILVIRPRYALQAVGAAIYADRANGVEWRKCAWDKCPNTFKVGKAKTKKYCGRDSCKNSAHSQTLRDKRKNQAL
jgi:hypothetical protein